MALDPSALLEQVEAAIEALLTGQHESYSIGSRSVTRLDMEELFEQRRLLKSEIERSSGGAMTFARYRRAGR